MPFEIFVIIIVAISAGTLSGIVKQVVSYKQQKDLQSGVTGEQGGVTTSELRQLMQDAVEDATEPLLDRMARLENRLEDTGHLPPADASLLLEEGEHEAAEERRSRQRVR
jgi:hypothetical protein